MFDEGKSTHSDVSVTIDERPVAIPRFLAVLRNPTRARSVLERAPSPCQNPDDATHSRLGKVVVTLSMTSEVDELVSGLTVSVAVELLDLLFKVGPTLARLVDDTEVVLVESDELLQDG